MMLIQLIFIITYIYYLSTKKSFKPMKCNDGALTIGYFPYGN